MTHDLHDARLDTLFDAAAESLILVDPADADSVAELIERLEALAAGVGASPGAEHPALAAVDAARRLAEGDANALAEVERAYSAARTRTRKPAPVATMPLSGDAELLADFGVRAVEHLDDADEHLIALEADPGDAAAVDAVFRAFHTIKGMAGFLALDSISESCHEAESLLADARTQAAPPSDAAIESLFSAVDRMRGLVFDATGCGGDVLHERRGDDALVGDAGDDDPAPAGLAEAVPARRRSGTVRVEEARLDALLDTIGEMVIAESMVSAGWHTGSDAAVVATQLERLDKITRELQQMATSLRMVPLRATFRRMERLVRDLAHKADKDVDLVVSGEDTELDKAVVDHIGDPLVHALRNAIDHGIELPDERRALGKPPTARVELRAFHAGGAIHVEVSDDGRGLDRSRILARAIDRGLVSADDQLTDEAVFGLIFEPGFSTADTVTEVSGRGVGMDVVRRTVEELRGRVEVRSEPGRGTTLSVRLPITLAIIDGMVTRVGDERYVIPMLSIERSIRPTAEQVVSVQGRAAMLALDDGMLPVLELHRLFGVPDAIDDPTRGIVIVVSDGGVRAGLLACELAGQQQTVIKPLGEGLPEQPGITGAAIMPDGRVGLILDAAGLVRLAHGKEGS